ncbi:MAG: threonine ammonia-lyase [Gammaproteobacteria bacterium]|nr:MAG: threonine ammonia-lyase [Gammaproteobacteria bacterium]
MTVTSADISAARERISDQIVRTPFQRSATLSAMTGAEIFLKFENQQFTASFKERGALNRLLQLSDAQASSGVIAMSAGNHAQAVAYHGRRLGIPTCIVMPRTTPNAKVEQTRVFDAEIVLHGEQFDETLAFTLDQAAKRGMTLVHPYEDPAVIAGQGTLGLEMMEQIDDLDVLVIPVGGGGLISGVALAAKSIRPIEIVGVQSERFPSAHNVFKGLADVVPGGGTVAEGIAVKSPGELTMTFLKTHVDDMLLVSEVQIEKALFSLLEIEKTVTEGAGAAGLAAVMQHAERFQGRRVGVVLSGGNIDMMILSSILQRGMVRSHRLLRLRVELSDVPGALADITRLLGELDSNIIDISHQRAFGGSSVRAAVVELVLQMRGEEQAEHVVRALKEHGFDAELAD